MVMHNLTLPEANVATATPTAERLEAEGREHLAACRWADAARSLRRAIELQGASAGAWRALGFALDCLGDETDSVRAYARAAELGDGPARDMLETLRRPHGR
jgi:Flp pilus assembly protein TadD